MTPRQALRLRAPFEPPRQNQVHPITPPVLPKDQAALLAEICAEHGISSKTVLEGRRTPKAAWARYEFWSHLRASGYSFESIGYLMGGYHHTTIMAGVRKWRAHVAGCCSRTAAPSNNRFRLSPEPT